MIGAPSLSTVNVSSASLVGAGAAAGAEAGAASEATAEAASAATAGVDVTTGAAADAATGAAAGAGTSGVWLPQLRPNSNASNARAAATASHHHFFDPAFSSITIRSSDGLTAGVAPAVDGCSRCEDTAFICAATPDRKLPAQPRPSALAMSSVMLAFTIGN